MKHFLLNKALRILLLTNGLVLIAAAMFGPIHAVFVNQIGGSLLDASLAGAAFALAAGITAFLSGKHSDKIHNKEMVVVTGYTIIGIGFLCHTVVESVTTLIIAQFIIGIGEAVYSPAFDAVYTTHTTKTRVGQQWGTWECMNYFSQMAGAMIGGLIASILGFDSLFLIMATLSFISALYIFRLPRKTL